ncbi:MAG: hypothetical protein IJI66_02855 [Erysipelotrichaceae bacterium]|nr:hypothetical protein [Erysipelotrichaceae bacterium]
MKILTWKEKADLIIANPQMSLKQIQRLCDVGQPMATQIRDKTKLLAEERGRWVGAKRVPADLVLEVIGLDYDYFKRMAKNEKTLSNIDSI